MAKISLIMPVYNSQKTIDYSINSVLNQTEQDFEFIVVNDGSTDDSLKKIEELKKQSNFSFNIYNKENGGAASARRLGLEKANSDIIGFIDSDDIIDKNYLKEMYDTLISTNTNICSSRFAFHPNIPVLKNIPLKNRKRNIKYDTFKDKKIVPIMNVVTNGKLYKREYIEISDKNFLANEDLSINYYLFAKARDVSFANDVTYHYIPNNSGLVSKNIVGYSWDKIKNTLLPLSELKSNFENGNLLDEYYNEVEQIFIKNIIDRINYIQLNLSSSNERNQLINTLYDYISYHFPNWRDNPYFLSNFKDFEIPDIFKVFQNRSKINKYEQTLYNNENEIFEKYALVSNKIYKLTK